MSEGASFVHTQRWPVSPSPRPPVAPGVGTPPSVSSSGGRMPAAASGLAAGQQAYQPQTYHPSVHQLGRAQSEMVPRGDEHADHLKKLHMHWSDTGLLQGPVTVARQQPQQYLQQQLRWQLLTSADRDGGSGDEAMRDRRNSIDSAQGAAARTRGGRYAPPFQVDPATSPQVVQAALDEVDYVQRHAPPQVAQGAADDPNFMQRRPNIELAFVRGDPSVTVASAPAATAWLPPVVHQQPPQAGMQQWQWPSHLATSSPARVSQPPAAAGTGLKLVLQQSSAGQSSFVVGDGRSGSGGSGGGSTAGEQLGTGVWESGMLRRLSGSDLTVEDIVQVQRSRMEKLRLELDKQNACLARLHAAADHLAYAIEEIRSHGQAATAAATAAIRARSGSIGGQVSTGRTKEMIVKLRLDNGNLLVHIEELQQELTLLRQGGDNRGPVEGASALRRDHSMPTPGEGVEHAEHPYTWPRGGMHGSDLTSAAGNWQLHCESSPSRSSAQQLPERESPDRDVPPGDLSTLESFAAAHQHDEGDSSGWNCDICTFLNHGMLNVCEMCEAPRMTGRPGQRTACCQQQGGCYCHVGVHGGGHL